MARKGTNSPVVRWGEQLDNQQNANSNGSEAVSKLGTPSRRYATRNSGVNNNNYYKTVNVDDQTFTLGQSVMIENSESDDDPLLGIIYRMWQDESQRMRILIRWLFRGDELGISQSKRNNLMKQPYHHLTLELFYSNSEDLIDPSTLISPIEILAIQDYNSYYPEGETSIPKSLKGYIFYCRRFFNEETAHFGDLDWKVFYNQGKGPFMNKTIDEMTFRLVSPKKSRTLEPKKPGSVKRRSLDTKSSSLSGIAIGSPSLACSRTITQPRVIKDLMDVSSEEEEEDDDDDQDYVDKPLSSNQAKSDRKLMMDVEDEDGIEKPIPQPTTPRKSRGGKSRKNLLETTTPQTQRRKRLLDVQPLPECGTPLARRLFSKSTFAIPTIREGATAYEVARQRLHVSAVPETLPCRENEFTEILMHLQSALEEGGSLCLYISGVPGAGKTATVREVIRTLQDSADQGDVRPFQFIELNGMKLTDPPQAYKLLWQAINKNNTSSSSSSRDRITPSHAAQLLDQHFNRTTKDPKGKAAILCGFNG